MSKEEDDARIEKCRNLSDDLLGVIKKHRPDADEVLTVLCQLYCKIGLAAEIEPFCLSHAVSSGLMLCVQEDEENEPDEDPKVHWASTGTQFH